MALSSGSSLALCSNSFVGVKVRRTAKCMTLTFTFSLSSFLDHATVAQVSQIKDACAPHLGMHYVRSNARFVCDVYMPHRISKRSIVDVLEINIGSQVSGLWITCLQSFNPLYLELL